MNFLTIISLLALGVSASSKPYVQDGVIIDGEFTYEGGDVMHGKITDVLTINDLQRQCRCFPYCYGKGAPCRPGNCECQGSNGCYRCKNNDPVCQPGPGSGQCL
ncbi:hypothetical protein E4U21_000259 [Claviceps maximensis]|nr:hypothetical protein E4U21_000259 [Claviceps maximensis]